MAWRRLGDKPLSKPMMVRSLGLSELTMYYLYLISWLLMSWLFIENDRFIPHNQNHDIEYSNFQKWLLSVALSVLCQMIPLELIQFECAITKHVWVGGGGGGRGGGGIGDNKNRIQIIDNIFVVSQKPPHFPAQLDVSSYMWTLFNGSSYVSWLFVSTTENHYETVFLLDGNVNDGES